MRFNGFGSLCDHVAVSARVMLPSHCAMFCRAFFYSLRKVGSQVCFTKKDDSAEMSVQVFALPLRDEWFHLCLSDRLVGPRVLTCFAEKNIFLASF